MVSGTLALLIALIVVALIFEGSNLRALRIPLCVSCTRATSHGTLRHQPLSVPRIARVPHTAKDAEVCRPLRQP